MAQTPSDIISSLPSEGELLNEEKTAKRLA